jgi:hypothetical protein
LALEQWNEAKCPVKRTPGKSPGKLPAGRTRLDRYSATESVAEMKTPGTFRYRVREFWNDTTRFETHFAEDRNFSIADEQSFASA